ncbi:hypothetical protein [Serratia sp. BIGb0163]|uniref:hypothetical protein n=1 Tax=Serratia sp. BIGb0163 TaxID=2940613 RepID=UPI002167CB97|nr:hypothetical protein [Serratia sp. BIGb0163]MCS4267310.1 hypothetical protein [Serratia sp. BIGb0163]
MNARVVTKNQRKTGTLLTYLIAGVGILSSVPALAAGAIYDATVSPLTITAVNATKCTATLLPTNVHIDAGGQSLDTSAGTVKVTCGSEAKVGLAIATSAGGPYADSATGTLGTGKGVLTITVLGPSGTTTETVNSSNNHSAVGNITKMVTAPATSGAATFSLTPSTTSTGVTQAGTFIYSLVSAAWVG